MSNHFSADNLKIPGDDRRLDHRLDLTGVFAFRSSDNPDKTVLIIDSNPTSAPPPIPAAALGRSQLLTSTASIRRPSATRRPATARRSRPILTRPWSTAAYSAPCPRRYSGGGPDRRPSGLKRTDQQIFWEHRSPSPHPCTGKSGGSVEPSRGP